jgi:hypothetical protein
MNTETDTDYEHLLSIFVFLKQWMTENFSKLDDAKCDTPSSKPPSKPPAKFRTSLGK